MILFITTAVKTSNPIQFDYSLAAYGLRERGGMIRKVGESNWRVLTLVRARRSGNNTGW
jgi:hypothetical protein